MKLFEMRLKCIEMKIGWALMAAIGIYSERHSIGFDQIEWVNRRGSSESTQTMMLLPRLRTEDPDPQDFCRQSLYSQRPPPHHHRNAHTPTHTPILHLHYFSIFQTVGVPSAAGPPSSCTAPITKLSAQFKEAAHLTAAKHFNIHTRKHTNRQTVLLTSFTCRHLCTCTSPDCSAL